MKFITVLPVRKLKNGKFGHSKADKTYMNTMRKRNSRLKKKKEFGKATNSQVKNAFPDYFHTF